MYAKCYDLKIIKRKIIAIYLLNVADIFFTLFLLDTGSFYEGNTIMRGAIGNKSLSLFVKIVIPLLLLIYIYIRMKKADQRQLYLSNIAINICLGFYLIVNVLHIIWITLYLTV